MDHSETFAVKAEREILPNHKWVHLPGVTVRNEGVSGTTACQLLNGQDGVHPAWDTQMNRSNATVVIINHAISDEWKYDMAIYKSCLMSLAQKPKPMVRR